ncbi:MAG: type II secretion system F family protein [Solirubrobacteraceae bacterium]|nr:type II secretion system F family protein [Solirubrobacteraceae bacterium]
MAGRRPWPQTAPMVAGAVLGGWLLLGPLGVPAGALAGAGLHHAIRGRSRRGDARACERGAGPLARSLADALRAGGSIRAALGAAAADRSVPAVVRARVARAALALAHGTPLPAALHDLGGRDSGYLTLLAAVVALHAERGGSLVQELHALAEDAEHGARLDEERAAATAQARATVRTVAALPLLALAGAQLLGGDLVGSVARRPVALALLASGLLLEFVAVLIARRIVARAA